MAFLFSRNRPKPILELVRSSKENLINLGADEKLASITNSCLTGNNIGSAVNTHGNGGGVTNHTKIPVKAEEELAKSIAQIKLILQGTQEIEANPDNVQQLIDLLIAEDFLMLLACNIDRLPFESRKDAQMIFSQTFRFRHPDSFSPDPPALVYIMTRRPGIIYAFCCGYDQRESAMPCGGVLRELIKVEAVAAFILCHEPDMPLRTDGLRPLNVSQNPASGKGLFWRFFDWIDQGSFEVSADAFSTFRELLTRHKPMVAQFLLVNFNMFFSRYNQILVQSNSYVIKRQSIKLLSEILLDRANYSVMTRYVDSSEHLKICMNLLLDDRRMINYEGFHVFKVFVANPNKSQEVQRMLINNRDRLLRFLPSFLDDRTDDDQFTDEKSFLIRQIELLP